MKAKTKQALIGVLLVLALIVGIVYAADIYANDVDGDANMDTEVLYIHGLNATDVDGDAGYDSEVFYLTKFGAWDVDGDDQLDNEVFYMNDKFAPNLDGEAVETFCFINDTLMEAPPVPAFGTIAYNTTYYGQTVVITCANITNYGDQVYQYWGRWNMTGTYTNFSPVNVGTESVLASFQGAITAAPDSVVAFEFIATNSWEVESVSGYQYFTVEMPPAPDEPDTPPVEPPPVGTASFLDFYFYATTHEINGVNGYQALTDPPVNQYLYSIQSSGEHNVSWGIRAYLQFNGSEVELTGGSPEGILTLLSQYGTQSGVYNTTVSIDKTSMLFGQTAIRFDVYSRWDSGAWTLRNQYITELLFYPSTADGDAVFTAYLSWSYSGGTTTAAFNWGTPTYFTGVMDFPFTQGSGADWQQYYLDQGDLTGFLIAPYTAQIGNLFYAIIMFAVGMSLYIRYRQMSIVVMLVALLGGTGGVINLLIGDAYMGVLWLITAFGLALIYWRLFR